jgi:ankyrin repeat protein
MPVLLTEEALKSKKYTSVAKKSKNWEQPLDISAKFRQSIQQKEVEQDDLDDPPKPEPVEDPLFQSKEWKHLYKNKYDKILMPAAVNNHFQVFKLHVEWGSELNIQDFQGWSPLH